MAIAPVPLFGILPHIKSTNQQGFIKTSYGNAREPSHHLIGQYSSSGNFLASAVEAVLSTVAAIARAIYTSEVDQINCWLCN